jgi:hypothetical protein
MAGAGGSGSSRGYTEVLVVLRESEEAVTSALGLVEGLVVVHPSLPIWLRSKVIARSVLSRQALFLGRISDAGEGGRAQGSAEGGGVMTSSRWGVRQDWA